MYAGTDPATKERHNLIDTVPPGPEAWRERRCTRPHVCRPLGAYVVRHVHFLLSGAFEGAVRWRWVGINPVTMATPLAAPKPNPQPPSPREAARIVEESWKDPDWGALVWTAMTTGARRGELCAVRLHSVDLDEGRETPWLRRAIRKEHGVLVEAELKSHQQRLVALDAETAQILREHIERSRSRAASLGLDLPADAFLFSGSPDSSTFPVPDSVTQRYDYLAVRLDIATTFHRLRHYSATELIAAGVDPRTVAGRLGHGGGGITTLRTCSAWVSEADQRAAKKVVGRTPPRPVASKSYGTAAFGVTPSFVTTKDVAMQGSATIGVALPTTKTVFVAFAIEDEHQRDLLKGQSLNVRAPFEYIDMSVKEPYDTAWKERVRTRIRRSHGVIVLVSRNSLQSTGQEWEIACAREEKKPIRGIWAYKDDRTNIAGVATTVWSDNNISSFIDSL